MSPALLTRESGALSSCQALADSSAHLSHPPAMLSTVPQLTDLERAMLDFEAKWWRHRGSKEAAILDAFELMPSRYYQKIAALIDRPEALDYAPQTVLRLQRIRDRGQRAANARRQGTELAG